MISVLSCQCRIHSQCSNTIFLPSFLVTPSYALHPYKILRRIYLLLKLKKRAYELLEIRSRHKDLAEELTAKNKIIKLLPM
jgi:hypothetical protein